MCHVIHIFFGFSLGECSKFHHYRICMMDFREGWLGPSWIGLKIINLILMKTSLWWAFYQKNGWNMQHEKKNDFNKLTYYYKIPGLAPLNVIGFKGTLHIYSEINMVKYHQ